MSRKRRSPSTMADSSSRPLHWSVLCLVALFVSRLLVPAEATDQGITLWQASLTFALGALFFGLQWREQRPWQMSWRLPDLAVALMVCGHLVSGVSVFMSAGNCRTALNMMWEWLALGVGWCLLRVILSTEKSRQLALQAFVLSMTSLALLGIWQHVVWYPQQAQRFERLLYFTEQIDTQQQLTNSETAEYQGLLKELGTEFATLDDAGRNAYLARVRDSVEPIGFFVLANTFALPLLLAFLVTTQQAISRFGSASRGQRLVLVLIPILLLYCLILTKSRTAFVGTAAGLVLILMISLNQTRQKMKLPRWAVLSTLAGSMTILIGAYLSGGIDREVISEAPKSLQYRLEYWFASLEMLSENPILGAGPGNFRQHYVRFKYPGASEEILDPHNLLLGIWSGGGLLALCGVVLFFVWPLLINHSTEGNDQTESNSASGSTAEWLVAPIAGFAVTFVVLFLLQGGWDLRLLVVATTLGLLGVVVSMTGISWKLTPAATLGALAAAFIHLLGASGIEMPAVVWLLFLLAVCLLPVESASATTDAGKSSSATNFAFAAACTLLLLASVFTGLVPVQLAQTEMAIGDSLMITENRPHLAERYYRNAASADSLSPEPYQQLGLLFVRQWDLSGRTDEELFQNAVEQLQNAIQRDPQAFGRYRMLGNFWDQKAAVSQSSDAAENAVEAYRHAVELYPHHATLNSEYAIALDRIRDPQAVDVAVAALELDELNRSRGHTDKLLSDAIRGRLQKIVSGEGEEQSDASRNE